LRLTRSPGFLQPRLRVRLRRLRHLHRGVPGASGRGLTPWSNRHRARVLGHRLGRHLSANRLPATHVGVGPTRSPTTPSRRPRRLSAPRPGPLDHPGQLISPTCRTFNSTTRAVHIFRNPSSNNNNLRAPESAAPTGHGAWDSCWPATNCRGSRAGSTLSSTTINSDPRPRSYPYRSRPFRTRVLPRRSGTRSPQPDWTQRNPDRFFGRGRPRSRGGAFDHEQSEQLLSPATSSSRSTSGPPPNDAS